MPHPDKTMGRRSGFPPALSTRQVLARILRQALLALGVLLALPLRLMAPLYRIEIQRIWGERIGHFALEPEQFICTRRLFPRDRCRTYFFCDPPVANDFLLSKWKQVLPLGPAWFMKPIFDASLRFPWLDLRSRDWHEDQTDLRVLDEFEPSVSFSASEHEHGRKLLAEIGVPPGNPYVCIAVRDSAYLATTAPQRDWSYHDYRDSDIDTYVKMCEWLASQGYAVVRMGKIVKDRLTSTHPMVIDYANSGLQSDFADVYLFANCDFCISTSTGMDSLAMLFRRPLGVVNLPVVGGMQVGGPLKLVMFKDMIDKASEEPLSFDDSRLLAAMRLYRTEAFAEMGIDLVDNTPEELLDFAREMVAITTVGLMPDPQIETRGRTLVRELTDDRRFDDADFLISPSWLARRPDR